MLQLSDNDIKATQAAWKARPRGSANRAVTWPINLRHLTILASGLPLKLLTGSANTLTLLQLSSPGKYSFGELTSVAPNLTQLNKLIIGTLVSHDQFTLPRHFAAFVAALPAVHTLDVLKLTPYHVEDLLAKLGPATPLRALSTTLSILAGNPLMLALLTKEPAIMAKWTTEWVPTLVRCAELPAMRSLEEWEVRVVVTDVGHGKGFQSSELTKAQLETWDERDQTKAGWTAFKESVRAAGVELNLGLPLPWTGPAPV